MPHGAGGYRVEAAWSSFAHASARILHGASRGWHLEPLEPLHACTGVSGVSVPAFQPTTGAVLAVGTDASNVVVAEIAPGERGLIAGKVWRCCCCQGGAGQLCARVHTCLFLHAFAHSASGQLKGAAVTRVNTIMCVRVVARACMHAASSNAVKVAQHGTALAVYRRRMRGVTSSCSCPWSSPSWTTKGTMGRRRGAAARRSVGRW